MKQLMLLIFPFLFFCLHNNRGIKIKGFDSEIWKKDSTGCLHLRSKYNLGETLYCCREQLIGLKEDELYSLLGTPNIFLRDTLNLDGHFHYYIEGAEQCWEGISDDDRTYDIKMLYIHTKKILLLM